MIIKSRISALQSLLRNNALNGYIIPINDEFQSGYTADYAKRLEFITGFTGSYGVVIILENQGIFFTDGRYISQAEKELDKSFFLICNISEIQNFPWNNFISEGQSIGYDPMLFTVNNIKTFDKLSLKAVPVNLIDKVWLDQPERPKTKIWKYEDKYAGKKVVNKIEHFKNWLFQNSLDAYLFTNSESICWLLNIRASDTKYCPVTLCYCLFSEDKIYLYCDQREIDENAIYEVVVVKSFADLIEDLNQIKNKVGTDYNQAPLGIINYTKANWYNVIDPVQLEKSIKTEKEIHNFKDIHIQDGIALCEFFAKLKQEQNLTEFDEYQLGQLLSYYRVKQKDYLFDSFPAICGFAENAAIIHYRADENKALKLNKNGLLLVDSGGHYLGGSTDVTRTIAIGQPTAAQKKFYTLVLKGHIALSSIIFPKNCTGANLDVLARQFLWQEKADYDHGTGHGVGNLLSIHEGPQRISLYDYKQKLLPGMIVSNEPGYYVPGAYGIRIENLQYVKEVNDKFLCFKPLTLVPYCMDLIDLKLLTLSEIEYLANYYKNIKRFILPNLSAPARKWFFEEYNFLQID